MVITGKCIILLKQEVKRSVEPLMAEINKIQQEKATMEQVCNYVHAYENGLSFWM